jgi:muramoyltetrapeptide carboxypeptidase
MNQAKRRFAMTKLRLPKRLAGPATIGIYAPSGAIDPQAIARAVDYLTAKGHRVIVAPQTVSQWRYFAGVDHERLDAFHRMLADSSIDILMAARGGYGWSRLLQDVDFSVVTETDKVIVGFSDFTAFSLAAIAKSKLVTFAGPMAGVDFGNENVSAFMEGNFWPLLSAANHSIEISCSQQPYPAQTIEGTIWGGNLSLLTHLVGTPYFPRIDGGILFLEEIAEEPYAVERMIFQLYHAGILEMQKALVLADFDNCQPTQKSRYPYGMAEVIELLRSLLSIPVLTGLPFGHIREKITIPVGGWASLNVTEAGFQLTFSAYNSERALL